MAGISWPLITFPPINLWSAWERDVARGRKENEIEDEDPASISPCIGVCKLDKTQRCVGCYRTIEEIKEAGSTKRA